MNELARSLGRLTEDDSSWTRLLRSRLENIDKQSEALWKANIEQMAHKTEGEGMELA
jgi:hypothetical protein